MELITMLNKPKLIGLTGQKGSGKSTAAFALRPHFARLSFAAPLKRMLLAMGLTPEEMEDKETVLPRYGRSPRYLMQTLGTEWGRYLVDQDHWINIARREAQEHLDAGINVVFDDVRFDNEALLIHELGGHVWQITRFSSNTQGHISEHGITPGLIDTYIYNADSKANLVTIARDLAELDGKGAQ